MQVDVTYNSFISRSFIKEFLAHDPISKFSVWTMEDLRSPLLEYVSPLNAQAIHMDIRSNGSLESAHQVVKVFRTEEGSSLAGVYNPFVLPEAFQPGDVISYTSLNIIPVAHLHRRAFRAARRFKETGGPAEPVRVYEKIRSGIWSITACLN